MSMVANCLFQNYSLQSLDLFFFKMLQATSDKWKLEMFVGVH